MQNPQGGDSNPTSLEYIHFPGESGRQNVGNPAQQLRNEGERTATNFQGLNQEGGNGASSNTSEYEAFQSTSQQQGQQASLQTQAVGMRGSLGYGNFGGI